MKISEIISIGLICCLLCGCSSTKRNITSEVYIEGGKEFPDTMVGTWRTEKINEYWQITFNESGHITSAVIQPGQVTMSPNQIKEFETLYNGKGVFEPGTWKVEVTETNEIAVTLELKHFYQDLGADAMEGDSTDIFIGEVSEDGKIWYAEWYSSGQYTALINYGPLGEKSKREVKKFAVSEEPEMREQLKFYKIK